MTIAEQTRLLLAALEPWAAANAGSVKVAGGKPMFILVEEARELARALRQDDIDESRPYYKGIHPIELPGAAVDAYYIELLLAADIPQQL